MEMLTGNGIPYKTTVGEPDQYYKDVDTGNIYKCVAKHTVSGTAVRDNGECEYVWELKIKDSERPSLLEKDETKPGFVKVAFNASNDVWMLTDNSWTAANKQHMDNHQLVKVTSSSIQEVGVQAFYRCISLTYVSLLACKSVNSVAFSYCHSLTHLHLPEATFIGDTAFSFCTSLANVNLPKAVTIDKSAFTGCTNLVNVDLPEATALNSNAFNGCKYIEELDLPKVMNIGKLTFSGCTRLTKLVLRSENVATLANSNAFTNTGIATGKGYIYVPDNLVSSYKTAANWSTYANQIKSINELA